MGGRRGNLLFVYGGEMSDVIAANALLAPGERSELVRALVRAARVGHAAIGRCSLRAGTLIDAEVASLSAPDGSAQEQVLAQAGLTIARTFGQLQRLWSGESDVSASVEGSGSGTITWLSDDRCLVGLRHDQKDNAPFVALLRKPSSLDFPRWQRDVARIALIYEGDRLRWSRGPAGPAEAGEIVRHLTIGLALVDADRRVRYANETALHLIGHHDDLRIQDGRLHATESGMQKRLVTAVQAATAAERRQPSVLTFNGTTGVGLPHVLTCAPLGSLPGRALLVFGQSSRSGEIVDLMLEALGLTCAERRLARLLLEGAAPEAAARANNITLSTARSYVKQIFAKTGVRRQSELVALIGVLVPPVMGPRTAIPQPMQAECSRR